MTEFRVYYTDPEDVRCTKVVKALSPEEAAADVYCDGGKVSKVKAVSVKMEDVS